VTDEQTTGTTSADDGDAAVPTPTTGTPTDAGRDAGASSEPDYKQLYLASKDKIEAANRMEAELAQLRTRREPPPDEDEDDLDEAAQGDGVDWDVVADFARRGDQVAKAQLANRRMNIELAKNVRDSFQLRDIDDRDERKEVLAHFAKNKHRLGDIGAARAEVRERKLETENVRLKRELELARKQPPTDVVRTHSREVSSTEQKTRYMAESDFDREQAELRAAGRHDEAMARQRELMSGAIDFTK